MLRFHLYADEFDPCNAIGADGGKHKISAFYFTIGNLHPKFRSQLRYIFLVLLVDYEIIRIKNSDYSLILEPLIRDLKYLQENGITVARAGVSRTVKG